jgi:hypothetical protein
MALVNGIGEVNGYHIGPRVNLEGANLAGADLTGAVLTDADIYNANLTNAILCDADLRGAGLAGANLGRADFTGADLTDANLVGVNLYLAKVDPHHVPLIQAAANHMVWSLKVNGRSAPTVNWRRAPNPPRRLTIEVRYIGGGGYNMGIPRYHVVDAAASADRMMGPGGHYFESRTIAKFDTRAEAEEYIHMVNDDRTPNPGLGTRRGPHGYKY